MKLLAAVVLTISLVGACTSPLELDVDRTKSYSDGSTNPLRLSFYYHFGDSAYEAIVVDPVLLNTVWIENDPSYGGMKTVTIPQFIFQLPESVKATGDHNPLVRVLCFSSHQQRTDGVWRMCVNENSWLEGDYLDIFGDAIPFHWPADDIGRQIRLAYFHLPEEKLIKGSIQVVVAVPSMAQFSTYKALMTIEY